MWLAYHEVGSDHTSDFSGSWRRRLLFVSPSASKIFWIFHGSSAGGIVERYAKTCGPVGPNLHGFSGSDCSGRCGCEWPTEELYHLQRRIKMSTEDLIYCAIAIGFGYWLGSQHRPPAAVSPAGSGVSIELPPSPASITRPAQFSDPMMGQNRSATYFQQEIS